MTTNASAALADALGPQHSDSLFAPDGTVLLEQSPQLAQVRVVVPLTQDEETRLRAYLERIVGRTVEMDVRTDRSILGGVWVRMDDLVIDGTVRARLSSLHERLCASCVIPQGAGPGVNRETL